jgi:hypothetical protein
VSTNRRGVIELLQEWCEHALNGQADPWTAAEPVYTANTLNTSLQASKEALATAMSSMEARGIPLDASIGEVQRAPQAGAAPIAWLLGGGRLPRGDRIVLPDARLETG